MCSDWPALGPVFPGRKGKSPRGNSGESSGWGTVRASPGATEAVIIERKQVMHQDQHLVFPGTCCDIGTRAVPSDSAACHHWHRTAEGQSFGQSAGRCPRGPAPCGAPLNAVAQPPWGPQWARGPSASCHVIFPEALENRCDSSRGFEYR